MTPEQACAIVDAYKGHHAHPQFCEAARTLRQALAEAKVLHKTQLSEARDQIYKFMAERDAALRRIEALEAEIAEFRNVLSR